MPYINIWLLPINQGLQILVVSNVWYLALIINEPSSILSYWKVLSITLLCTSKKNKGSNPFWYFDQEDVKSQLSRHHYYENILLMNHLNVGQIHSSSWEEFLMTLAILWDLKRQKCDNLWKLRGAGGPSVGLPWDENYLLIMNRLLRVWKPPTSMITNRYRNFVNYFLKIIIVFLHPEVYLDT